MKTLKFALPILVGSLILFGCSKDTGFTGQGQNEPNSTDLEVSPDKGQDHSSLSTYSMHPDRAYILSLADVQEQKVHWSSITAATKFNIWNNKMEQVLSLTTWTTSQYDALVGVHQEMSVGAFDASNSEYGDFNSFMGTWRATNEALFADWDLPQIFTATGDYISAPDPSNPHSSPASGITFWGCSCSTASDWCFGGSCYSLGPCVFPIGDDGNSCGSFWRHPCDGNCVS